MNGRFIQRMCRGMQFSLFVSMPFMGKAETGAPRRR